MINDLKTVFPLYKLIFIFVMGIWLLFVVKNYAISKTERVDFADMKKSEKLAISGFQIIETEKRKRDIPVLESFRYSGMIGVEYTEMTTTLGSLEAKELSANPQFASLIIKWIDDAGLDSNSVVGVNLSGSFPSLMISVFSALEVRKIKYVVLTSVGASSYGANQPEATILDMQSWLNNSGLFHIHPDIISLGSENESGEGLLDEGVVQLLESVKRNKINLTEVKSFDDILRKKTEYLENEKINLFINIGGNQTGLGKCIHSSMLPNGFWKNVQVCDDSDSGLLSHFYSKNISIINLLNIKELVMEYQLSPNSDECGLYFDELVNKFLTSILVSGWFFISVFLLYKKPL